MASVPQISFANDIINAIKQQSEKLNTEKSFNKKQLNLIKCAFDAVSETVQEGFADTFGTELVRQTISIVDIEKMFESPAKGGLKIAEIRAQAEKMGIETKGVKKDELKELMLAKASDEADAEEEDAEEEVAAEEEEVDEEEADAEEEEEEADANAEEEEVDEEEVDAEEEEEAKEPQTCQYILTRGANKGEQCPFKTKDGTKYCSKHKTWHCAPLSGSFTSTWCEQDASESSSLLAVKPKDGSKHSEDSEESEKGVVCGYTIVKGQKKGEQCSVKPKHGETFCSKHRKSESAKSNDESNSVDSEESEKETVCGYTIVKGQKKGEQCSVKPKHGEMFCSKHRKSESAKSKSNDDSNENATTCRYIGTRGAVKDKPCEIKPADGECFCNKHATTQQAINYYANESPAAKKIQAEEKSSGLVVKRNKDFGIWVVGDNLVVRSPNKPTVYAYLTKNGELKNKLSPTVRAMAEEMGLDTEE